MEEQGKFGAPRKTEAPERSGESGIIIFGGGGRSGPGCLFWILISVILSVTLTVIGNLLFVVF
ncbi:hypothetical protein GBA65_20115 [Rubrobacter marinus]|uniref:Uncharacterized protein n=1 Tax=Rubrobacter marinus TaxID=2653852 RepID=A0A6G8Q1U4_9ACTN|nr:hypothetical protein [Rubrobacter marinus]QIN80436.1 hypothetical protein GBA65_20115 [Rubrobacter marinus]